MVFGLFKNINLVGTVDLLVEWKISHLKLEFSSFHAPPKLATCFRRWFAASYKRKRVQTKYFSYWKALKCIVLYCIVLYCIVS